MPYKSHEGAMHDKNSVIVMPVSSSNPSGPVQGITQYPLYLECFSQAYHWIVATPKGRDSWGIAIYAIPRYTGLGLSGITLYGSSLITSPPCKTVF